MELGRTDAPATGEYATVYVALELSKAKWKLGIVLPGSEKMSRYTIDGGDLGALMKRLEDARGKAARQGQPVRVLSCYEAGYDGHWLHRWLTGQGVINHEIDPSAVNRRARYARNARISRSRSMRSVLACPCVGSRGPAACYGCRRPNRKTASAAVASASA
jgi:transposase